MGKWKIQVTVGAKHQSTAFETEQAAREAYDNAALELANRVPFVKIGDLTVKSDSVTSMKVFESAEAPLIA
jgi:hypothetical protein